MLEKLPHERLGYTKEMAIGGIKMFLRTGEYVDGRLGEIFINLADQGTTVRGMADAFAIAFSLGLQHGVPLETYIRAFSRTKFPPEGIVQNHPYIKTATSFAALIVRELGIHYLKRTDLASIQIQPEGLVPDAIKQTVIDNPSQEEVKVESTALLITKMEQLAQDSANNLQESVLLILDPPKGLGEGTTIPYVVRESIATSKEVRASVKRFVPQLTAS